MSRERDTPRLRFGLLLAIARKNCKNLQIVFLDELRYRQNYRGWTGNSLHPATRDIELGKSIDRVLRSMWVVRAVVSRGSQYADALWFRSAVVGIMRVPLPCSIHENISGIKVRCFK